jgi:hypothetical protein
MTDTTWRDLFERAEAYEVSEDDVVETLARHRESDE